MTRRVCYVFLYACAAVAVIAAAAVARAQQPAGGTVYEKYCVECHGTSGRGDGPSAAYLTPRPRDFTRGSYKIRTTETGSVPTDEDLIRTVRQGVYGSAMPGWDRILSDADIRDVVSYIKTLTPQFATPPKIVTIGEGAPSTPESVARGRAAYDRLQCGKCHGTDGRGTGAVTTEFEDAWRQPLRAANLTEPWTFHGGGTARDVYLRLRTGMMGTPMPSFADAASDAEMWDLANFVVSLARKPVWQMTADEAKTFFDQQKAESKANPVARGRYLTETLGCVMCHSPMDEQKRMLPDLRLAGGLRMVMPPFGEYPTGNLTSDKATGLGNWTDDQIGAVITKGILPDGTRLLPYPMDWASMSTMDRDDIDAIVAYLRTVPAVSNAVPKPRRTSFPAYMWGKVRMLVLGADVPMTFYAGNAGTAGGQ